MHKIQIRKAVFETNSSSSHSLTLGKGDLVKQPFSSQALRSGVIELSVGEYGWEYHRYYSPEEKLKYLLTQVTNGSVRADIDELCAENERVAMLRRVVKEHTGCDLQLQPSTGYIDHQSAMGDGGNGLELFNSDETLKSFLFDQESYIETGNDNSSAPWSIDTDRGTELYYESAMRDVPKSYVLVTLSRRERYGVGGFITEAGAILAPNLNEDLYARLVKTGVVAKAEWTGQGPYSPFEYEEVNGYTAGCIADRAEPLNMARDMTVVNKFKKTKSDYKDPKNVRETLVMFVRVSPALAKALNALPATPQVLGELSTARLELVRMTAQATESAEDWLVQQRIDAEKEVAKLEEQAKQEGLL